MQRFSVYAIGQTALLEAWTTDPETGDPVPPPNPRILLRNPSGTESELAATVVVDEGYFYHALHITGPSGTYAYRMLTDDDSQEREFAVAPSNFTLPLGAP